MNRVVITGIGVISPLGNAINDVWSKLILGQSAVKVLPEIYNKFPCRIASQIDEISIKKIKKHHLNPSEHKTMSRPSVLAMKAASDAMFCAGISDLNDENLHKYGVSIGIGFDGVDNSMEVSKFNNDHLPYNAVGPYALTRALGNMPAAHLSMRYKMMGPSRSVNTACAAGLHAIGDAFRSVQTGEALLMLAGGTEASISPWSIAAFSRIRALPTRFNECPDTASRPFDKTRSGFVMAEGAGILVVEALSHALHRGRRPLAEIVAFAQCCDGSSLVAPDSEGDGAYRAMRAAIEAAGLGPEQISYINAHATSTPQGDLVECQAIDRLFGKHALVGSFKGQLGHCLGASGGVETALTVKCIMESQIPPNGNLNEPDPSINVSLVPGDRKPHAWTSREKIVLKNSFGFGGTNCSIVIRSFADD